MTDTDNITIKTEVSEDRKLWRQVSDAYNWAKNNRQDLKFEVGLPNKRENPETHEKHHDIVTTAVMVAPIPYIGNPYIREDDNTSIELQVPHVQLPVISNMIRFLQHHEFTLLAASDGLITMSAPSDRAKTYDPANTPYYGYEMEPAPGKGMMISYGISNLELTEKDGVITFRDDFPYYGPLANKLKPHERALIENMMANGGVVTDGTAYYIYCRTIGSWSQLYSGTAAGILLDETKINAPVSYAKALKWAYSLLKMIATPIKKVFPSVCIGTYRLIFMCQWTEENLTVHYRPHWPVIDNKGMDPMYNRIFSFVVSPIIPPSPIECPYAVSVRHDDEVINKILLPLRYDQRLDFLWRMGKLIISPVKDPSVIVFFGREGHEGKTVLADTVSRILSDCSEWVSLDLFGSKSQWPDAETVMYLCEKRLLICDECRIEDGFAYNNVKRWTSEAPITMNGLTGFLCQTSIVVSNHIPFTDKAGINNSIGRRLVIYHMQKRMSKFQALDKSEITNRVALRFISLCLGVATAFERPPTSLAIALYTFFRKNTNKITAGLVHDVAASREDSIAATVTMAVRCGVTGEKLCSAFHAMSPALVDMNDIDYPYIKSIRVAHVQLSEHGQNYVEQREKANIPEYNLEAMLERGVTYYG
ncbi:hypothetical protein KC359_g8908 [Hortaea werneckii]|nr:hypothetical protein KC359_g8908 [Hortaea werneckii]